jgi:uncharacterized protein
MAISTTDQHIDKIVWSMIKNSQNPNDFIGFIRHARDREVDYETAISLAVKNWGNQDAVSLFPQAVASLERLAQEGCSTAMYHLGLWHRLGFGVPVDSDKGVDWYKQGMAQLDGRCLMSYAYTIMHSDPVTAKALYAESVELGYLFAHSYWAEIDKEHYMEHIAEGAKGSDPLGVYFYAHELLKRAEKEHERENAFDIMKRAANLGATNASFMLAMIFLYGEHGKKQDQSAAEYWLNKGIRRGSVACIAALGKLLLCEKPDRKNEGLKHLLRAAVMDDANAQYFLGKHQMESGQTKDECDEGLQWLLTAAQKERSFVCYLLGENYRRGVGVELNLTEAAKWYKKGADLGNTSCQCAYGLALIHADGVDKDLEKAHNLFHAAHAQGDGVSVDKLKAIEYFREGAHKGDVNCAFALGIAYLFADGVEEDYPAALKWLKLSADQGSTRAKAYLGLMFLNGSGVQADIDIAIQWLSEAAHEGNALAMRELGDLYFKGERVTLNMEWAKRWMGKAAANGDSYAINWIQNNCPEKPTWLNSLLSDAAPTLSTENSNDAEGSS